LSEKSTFYSMSVADNHNLIANGMLVSNCYQEQIMQICQSLAGMSVTDGYIMIKAIGKKVKALMDKYENKFIQGAVDKGVPESIMKTYWDKFIFPFSQYGFNASHSCCYAVLSYYCAYLKANYPDEFVLASLNVQLTKNSPDRFDKIKSLESDFSNKLNIKIIPAHINRSKATYYISRKKDLSKGIAKTEIVKPLLCKGLGIDAAIEIEKKQPYADFEDFVKKVDPKIVNARSVAALVDNKIMKSKNKNENLVDRYNAIKSDVKRAKKAGINLMSIC
jgi:DNA polymerase-3 subunit alpha